MKHPRGYRLFFLKVKDHATMPEKKKSRSVWPVQKRAIMESRYERRNLNKLTDSRGKRKMQTKNTDRAECLLFYVTRAVSRHQQGLQGTGMEDNLSAECNAVGLAWLRETQMKPILPPWRVVRRETAKSVKRGKFNADWLPAFSLSFFVYQPNIVLSPLLNHFQEQVLPLQTP